MGSGTLPRRARIAIPQYADRTWLWNWISGGAPVDFTGCTAAFALRVAPSDPAPLLAVSTTPNASGYIALGTVAGPLAVGLVQLTLLRAGNVLLTCAVCHGDLLITMSDGSVIEFLRVDADVFAGSTY